MSTKIYKCAKHGVIDDKARIIFEIYKDNIKKVYCVRCLLDFLDKTIGEVEEIETDKT